MNYNNYFGAMIGKIEGSNVTEIDLEKEDNFKDFEKIIESLKTAISIAEGLSRVISFESELDELEDMKELIEKRYKKERLA